MPAVARLGDMGQHLPGGPTGNIVSASATSVTTADGKTLAVEGDLYLCSNSDHGIQTLLPYPTQTESEFFDGKRLITVGSMTTCGAKIIQGFATTITLPPAAPINIGSYNGITTVNVPLVIPENVLTATALDLDLLPMNLISVQDAVNGVVSITPPGFVTFTPDIGFTGTASFTYTLGTVNGNISPNTASITVTP